MPLIARPMSGGRGVRAGGALGHRTGYRQRSCNPRADGAEGGRLSSALGRQDELLATAQAVNRAVLGAGGLLALRE
jgi:hypothetical protein